MRKEIEKLLDQQVEAGKITGYELEWLGCEIGGNYVGYRVSADVSDNKILMFDIELLWKVADQVERAMEELEK